MIKPIIGYKGLYTISNTGSVYSYYKKGILTPNSCNRYLTVRLYNGGVYTNPKIHQLVARAFVSGWFEGAVVNHIDEDKLNNHYTNLEWVTSKYNYSYSKDKRNEAIEQLQARYWLITHPNGEEEIIYNLHKFCIRNDLAASHMYSVAKGVRKQHKGFTVIGVKP